MASKYSFIKKRLRDIGKSQVNLAQHLGINKVYLNNTINGTREIQTSEFIPLIEFLEYDIVSFMNYVSGKQTDPTKIKDKCGEFFKRSILVEVLTEIERWLDENDRELNPVDKIKLLFVLYDKVCDVEDSFERKVKLRTLIEVGYQMS